VAFLRANGFEAVHWTTVGDPKAADRELMAHAAQHQFVVLTHDLDFGAILAASNLAAPSVVQIRAGSTDPDAIASHLLLALRQVEPELAAGALVTVDLNRHRVRVLPLRQRE
jgi:predicted nuclease of predicted toxin-antitoxin system